MGKRLTDDGVTRVSVEPAEGTATNLISPNWCDRGTWYFKATKTTGAALTNSGDNLTYTGIGPWIDNYHGRYSDEDTLTNELGDIPRLKVYVNSVEKTEQDPNLGSGGDYTVDYDNGSVAFLSANAPGDTVTADFWVGTDSCWVIKPASGKKLKIKAVEAQFSADVSIRDTLHFKTFGYVDVFAPQLVDNPYPSGTLIPISDKVYKTMLDYINEANGAMPLIHKTTNPAPGWRDITQDIQTYPWNYQAVKTLYSSYGMETRIYLKNNVPFDGTLATATFYCFSVSED